MEWFTAPVSPRRSIQGTWKRRRTHPRRRAWKLGSSSDEEVSRPSRKHLSDVDQAREADHGPGRSGRPPKRISEDRHVLPPAHQFVGDRSKGASRDVYPCLSLGLTEAGRRGKGRRRPLGPVHCISSLLARPGMEQMRKSTPLGDPLPLAFQDWTAKMKNVERKIRWGHVFLRVFISDSVHNWEFAFPRDFISDCFFLNILNHLARRKWRRSNSPSPKDALLANLKLAESALKTCRHIITRPEEYDKWSFVLILKEKLTFKVSSKFNQTLTLTFQTFIKLWKVL